MMLFTIQFRDSQMIYGIFNAISKILTEVRITITEKELILTGLDGSHICVVDLHLLKEDCERYECPKTIEILLNLDDLVKILKRAEATDQICLKYNSNAEFIQIEILSLEKKERIYELDLIKADLNEIDMQTLCQLDYLVNLTFNVKYLNEAIADAALLASVIDFHATDHIQFAAENCYSRMKYLLSNDSLSQHQFKGPVHINYAIQFLKQILTISEVCPIVTMKLNSESPVWLSFPLFKGSYIQYFLAPRVEEESEDTSEDDD